MDTNTLSGITVLLLGVVVLVIYIRSRQEKPYRKLMAIISASLILAGGLILAK